MHTPVLWLYTYDAELSQRMCVYLRGGKNVLKIRIGVSCTWQSRFLLKPSQMFTKPSEPPVANVLCLKLFAGKHSIPLDEASFKLNRNDVTTISTYYLIWF